MVDQVVDDSCFFPPRGCHGIPHHHMPGCAYAILCLSWDSELEPASTNVELAHQGEFNDTKSSRGPLLVIAGAILERLRTEE